MKDAIWLENTIRLPSCLHHSNDWVLLHLTYYRLLHEFLGYIMLADGELYERNSLRSQHHKWKCKKRRKSVKNSWKIQRNHRFSCSNETVELSLYFFFTKLSSSLSHSFRFAMNFVGIYGLIVLSVFIWTLLTISGTLLLVQMEIVEYLFLWCICSTANWFFILLNWFNAIEYLIYFLVAKCRNHNHIDTLIIFGNLVIQHSFCVLWSWRNYIHTIHTNNGRHQSVWLVFIPR